MRAPNTPIAKKMSAKGVNMETVCKATGLSNSTVGAARQGEMSPTSRSVFALYFKCPEADLGECSRQDHISIREAPQRKIPMIPWVKPEAPQFNGETQKEIAPKTQDRIVLALAKKRLASGYSKSEAQKAIAWANDVLKNYNAMLKIIEGHGLLDVVNDNVVVEVSAPSGGVPIPNYP